MNSFFLKTRRHSWRETGKTCCYSEDFSVALFKNLSHHFSYIFFLKIEAHSLLCHSSKSAPTSRRASNFSIHEEDFDTNNRGEEDPSSLAPALSIGAISTITGVSCFDDDDNGNGSEDGDVEDPRREKADVTSLISGLSSPAVDTFSSPAGQRALSEPLQPAPSVNEESRLVADPSDANKIRRQRIRRKRTRKCESKPKLGYLEYDAVAATIQRNAFAGTPNPGSRMIRKVRTLPNL